MYIHGDSSAEGVIMRAGQPFAMRYPLIEVEGSYGTLLASGSWSAPRYTSARLSPLANYLFLIYKKRSLKNGEIIMIIQNSIQWFCHQKDFTIW